MCVKLPPRDLNSDFYLSHPINIYICEVTILPRVCGDNNKLIQIHHYYIKKKKKNLCHP